MPCSHDKMELKKTIILKQKAFKENHAVVAKFMTYFVTLKTYCLL